jgi:hypothetical protein
MQENYIQNCKIYDKIKLETENNTKVEFKKMKPDNIMELLVNLD